MARNEHPRAPATAILRIQMQRTSQSPDDTGDLMPTSDERESIWYRNRLDLKRYAEEQPLPARFTVTASDDLQQMEIADRVTGARSTVAIFAYRAGRKVLHDLFG